MSTKINVIIGNQRLLQESKTRAAANQQSLDSRLEERQLVEQLTEAIDEATPEDPRSDAFSLQLDRRPAAQRRIIGKEEEFDEEGDPRGSNPREEFDEKGNLKVRYIGLFKPIRTDNVRANTVTWDTLYVVKNGNITTQRVYSEGKNAYRIVDIVFRPSFDFLSGESIVTNSVSAPPVYALDNVEMLSWVFRLVGTYFPGGVAAGPVYVSAPVGKFPFIFNRLQALERRIYTLASSTPSHVYYSYAYISLKAAIEVVGDPSRGILGEIGDILFLSDAEASFIGQRTYTISRVFNVFRGAPVSTECGFIKMDKRTGKIDFRQATSPESNLSFFVDNLYQEDPHYAVAQRSFGSRRDYIFNTVPKWPSNVQYNPDTGVVIVIAIPSFSTGDLREVYQRTFPTNFTYPEILNTLIDYIPYDARSLQAGRFKLIGTVNRYDPFGEVYTEIFPLIFR
jgi:hypothetical protein